jgi:hypothetical protein
MHGSLCSAPHKELFASLYYYQKGNNCLQISGKAFVENADEALLNARLVEKNALNKIVLLKMNILKAEYFKAESSAKISFMDRIKSLFIHLLYPNPYRMYDFSS